VHGLEAGPFPFVRGLFLSAFALRQTLFGKDAGSGPPGFRGKKRFDYPIVWGGFPPLLIK
jgi:hypothetical protein